MSCTLNKLTTYGVGRVIHDNNTGSYTAQLIQPPTSCPDNVFVSKKAQIKVVGGINPQLIFDVAQGRPVIMVPRDEYVEQVGSSGIGFGLGLFMAVAVFGLLALFLVTRRRPATATGSGYAPSPNSGPSGPNPNYQGGSQNQGGGTTIINNGSSDNGLLTGVMLGSMMSGNRSERIIEHDTTIIERDSSRSSDSDSNYSSDSSKDDSYSSDSSSDSSYSSDDSSSSSFSSDSSSDSSFSSDSGGGSFSSDS